MLSPDNVKKFLREALNEDIGRIDLTTTFLIPSSANIKANIIAKSSGIAAGLPIVEMLYSCLNRNLRIKFNVKEGGEVEAGKAVCFIEGQATSILKGERLALNILSRLSGIATLTKKFADKARPYNVEIFDTRKTTPNMRYLEKYAVKLGGGRNHRMGLYDQILIKDNHLAVLKELKSSSKQDKPFVITDSVKTVRKRAQKNVKVEIEVRNIAEFEEALAAETDIILLQSATSH